MNNPFQPRFQHDCKNCHFFRQYKDLDLYYCARSEADFGGTIVARYGNDAPEYHSSPVSVLLGSTLEHGVHDAHDAMVKLAKRLLGDGYVRLSTNYEKLREKVADDAIWSGVDPAFGPDYTMVVAGTNITWHFMPSLPEIGKVNGFWDDVPIIIARKDGRVDAGHFSYYDDAALPGQPVPEFLLEYYGVPMDDVVAWAHLPYHPERNG